VSRLGRIALRPSNYYSQFVFLEEYNFGGICLERREIEEDEEVDWVIPCDEGQESTPIVPTVVSSWNMMHYLGSEIAQEYFRLVIGRIPHSMKDPSGKPLACKILKKGVTFRDNTLYPALKPEVLQQECEILRTFDLERP